MFNILKVSTIPCRLKIINNLPCFLGQPVPTAIRSFGCVILNRVRVHTLPGQNPLTSPPPPTRQLARNPLDCHSPKTRAAPKRQ